MANTPKLEPPNGRCYVWLAQLFLHVFLGLTLTGPNKASKRTVLHNRLNKEKNSWSMLPIWLLAAMMIMMYYWRFWEPWANAMLAILLPKLWFGLKIMTGTTVFACLPGAHLYWTQKKLQNEQFYIIDWIKKKLLVDVANLAPCCHDDYDVLLEVLGTLGKCYVSNADAKTLVWIENHDWHNCFCMSSWGSPLLDPKKLQNEQFYIIDWIRKKLLVDVANLAPCCHDDYDVLLEVLGTLGKCYVSNPVAKTLVWIENHDWHNCFCMSSWGSPLLDPKKLQNEQFYIVDWIRKKLLVDVANLAPCCHDDYDIILKVLGTLGKCYVSNPVAKTLVWIENHDWHNCFCMSSWGSPLTGLKKASKRTVLHNRLNKEKTPGRCCQSGSLLPWWLWCTIGGLGTLGKCYVSNPVAKTLVWIENHDWHNCFCMSSWGSPLLDPKKLQNEQFYIIDWIRKKLLVDVANLAPCCHGDYDVLLQVLGTLGKCYVSNPVAKTLVWIEKSWLAQLFLHVFLGLTLTGPKKASKRTVLHNRLNKKKTPGRCCQSGSLLPWWLWCTIGGFGNPGQMLC